MEYGVIVGILAVVAFIGFIQYRSRKAKKIRRLDGGDTSSKRRSGFKDD